MAKTADDLLTMFRLGKQSQRNFGMQIPKKDVAMSKRGDMAKEWYEGWKKQNGLPADSNALPPVDSTPTWARPYLFPKAEATPNKKGIDNCIEISSKASNFDHAIPGEISSNRITNFAILLKATKVSLALSLATHRLHLLCSLFFPIFANQMFGACTDNHSRFL